MTLPAGSASRRNAGVGNGNEEVLRANRSGRRRRHGERKRTWTAYGLRRDIAVDRSAGGSDSVGQCYRHRYRINSTRNIKYEVLRYASGGQRDGRNLRDGNFVGDAESDAASRGVSNGSGVAGCGNGART